MRRSARLERFLHVLLLAAAFAVMPAQADQPPSSTSSAASPSPTSSGYTGSELCGLCHTAIYKDFYRNPHFKSIAAGKETPDKTGCEGCHGPGAAHVSAGGGSATIRDFKQMAPGEVLDTCLSCHAKDLSRVNIRRSPHTEADVVCTNCHSIHGGQAARHLLVKKQSELCYGCHAQVRAQFAMPFKHRVNEGVVACTDCHNPHGSFASSSQTGTASSILAASHENREPCLKCHVDKSGPFVFEHASVAVEGCTICHAPHGSANAKLLTRPVVATVCLECHNGAGSFGRDNTGVTLQSGSHNLLNPAFQQCTQCHVKIHGSSSDPNFLR